jgi:hypothetical protein
MLIVALCDSSRQRSTHVGMRSFQNFEDKFLAAKIVFSDKTTLFLEACQLT